MKLKNINTDILVEQMKERKIHFKFCFVKLFFVPFNNTNAEHFKSCSVVIIMYYFYALLLSLHHSPQNYLCKNVTKMFTVYQLMMTDSK